MVNPNRAFCPSFIPLTMAIPTRRPNMPTKAQKNRFWRTNIILLLRKSSIRLTARLSLTAIRDNNGITVWSIFNLFIWPAISGLFHCRMLVFRHPVHHLNLIMSIFLFPILISAYSVLLMIKQTFTLAATGGSTKRFPLQPRL